MPVVTDQPTYDNKKPRSQWKDRFIYTMLGLFAGMVGVHNFYLRRWFPAVLQVILAAVWIAALSRHCTSAEEAKISMLVACAAFTVELVWVTLELFLVSREPDGDAMNDESRPIRIMLIIVFWIAFIILPLIFTLIIKGSSALTDPVADRIDAAEHAADAE